MGSWRVAAQTAALAFLLGIATTVAVMVTAQDYFEELGGGPLGPSVASTVYQVNPNGTDAQVYGTLRVAAEGARPCLRVPLLATDPAAPEDNQLWFVDDTGTHKGCYRSGGTNYCWTATALP